MHSTENKSPSSYYTKKKISYVKIYLKPQRKVKGGVWACFYRQFSSNERRRRRTTKNATVLPVTVKEK